MFQLAEQRAEEKGINLQLPTPGILNWEIDDLICSLYKNVAYGKEAAEDAVVRF